MKEYKYRPQKWREEINQFMLDNRQLEASELYEKLKIQFPDFECTFTAMKNQRSRIKACPKSRKEFSTKSRPLYSEQIKKGYIRIKVAQPNVWWSKQKWVYLETHPWEYPTLLNTDCFYFADGNNMNFDPDNIILVHRREQTVFINQFGGICKDDPEQTKINLLNTRRFLMTMDIAEKAGLVSCYGSGRALTSDFNERRRNYCRKRYKDPEVRKKHAAYSKKRYDNMTPEQKEKLRAYQREWNRKRRERQKQGPVSD